MKLIDIDNKKFLEFYGALLGDGWLSKLSYDKYNKTFWIVGISGHIERDRKYLVYRIKPIVNELFDRKGIFKYKTNQNAMEFVFGHKVLINELNKKLGFSIGKKTDLKIEENIAKDWNKIKFVIRGLFDTDGSLYFDKTQAENPYPTISIHMKSPVLLSQVREKLLEHGFKVQLRRNGEEIKLKGSRQLDKWFSEIGPMNEKHIKKYIHWLNRKSVPVAQLGQSD